MIVTTPEAERLHQLDALGAALVTARRELIHAGHLIADLDLDGIRLDHATAIACIDAATLRVQDEIGEERA